jgi:hypothetical protein
VSGPAMATRRGFFERVFGGFAVALGVKAATERVINRDFERISSADQARLWALERAVASGRGAYRGGPRPMLRIPMLERDVQMVMHPGSARLSGLAQ